MNVFIQYIGRDDKGLPLIQHEIHESWHSHIEYCWENNVHPAILAPWGFGKSVQVAVYRPLYEIGKDPNLRVKIVSNNDDNAAKRVTAIVNLIEKSKEYRRSFPNVIKDPNPKNKWTRSTIFVKRSEGVMSIDPTLEAYGVLGAGTGGRADLLIFDDVCDRKNSVDEPTSRLRVIENFREVWMSRLVPGGRIIYINTRWHKEDLNGVLLKNSKYCFLVQAISEDFNSINCEVINAPNNKHPLFLDARAA